MKYTILTLFSLLILYSCKNANAKVVHEDLIFLNPNLNEIQKKYHKYSTLNSFHPDYYLYSPIEPSKKEKGRAKTLISIYNEYNFNDFFKYIGKNMEGKYEGYIAKNDTIIYRMFMKIYKEGEKRDINNLGDIENYFNQHKIGYRKIKDKTLDREDEGYVFLVKGNNIKDSALCVFLPSKEYLQISLYYNKKNAINSLSRVSVGPYYGKEIED